MQSTFIPPKNCLPSPLISTKKVVEINVESWEKKDSIRIFKEIASHCENPRPTEIREFLSNFQTNYRN